MANHSQNSLEMPLRLSAFSNVLPQVICGQPTGRECATKLVSNCRGARLMSIHATSIRMNTSQLLLMVFMSLSRTRLYCLMSPRSTPSATKVVHATTLFSPLWSSQVTEKLLLSSFGAGFEWIRVSSCHASLDPSHEIQRQ